MAGHTSKKGEALLQVEIGTLGDGVSCGLPISRCKEGQAWLHADCGIAFPT